MPAPPTTTPPGAFPGSGATNQPDTDPSEYPATAVVTFAGWDTGSKTLQAGGLVSGTTDTSGKCTFTATKDGVTRTATSTAQASASSVNCAQVSFPAAKVSSGTWSVTLTYAVGSASTTSDPPDRRGPVMRNPRTPPHHPFPPEQPAPVVPCGAPSPWWRPSPSR
ncbi:hypothetical protein WDV91_12325 [Curtobacterium flaccumfaciens pv. flaccumfaciens]